MAPVRDRVHRDTLPGVEDSSAADQQPAAYRTQLRARFKFDDGGRYYVHGNMTSGTSFVSSWNNTGIGTGDPVGTVRVRHFFGGLSLVKGDRSPDRQRVRGSGEAPRFTTYDEDGYLVGERVQIMRPEDIWFDQVSLTSARLGDFSQPNAFGRFDGFDDPNYYQGLLQKRLTKQITWSTDFTAADGERTMRAGVAWTPSFGTFRLEGYERWREQPAGGLSLSGERQLARNFRAVPAMRPSISTTRRSTRTASCRVSACS